MVSMYDYCKLYKIGKYYNNNFVRNSNKAKLIIKRSFKLEPLKDSLQYEVDKDDWKDRHLFGPGASTCGFMSKIKTNSTHIRKINDYINIINTLKDLKCDISTLKECSK